MMSIGSIIRIPANRGGYRVWRVVGVFLGETDQESVIELETLDLKPTGEGRMCVPHELLTVCLLSPPATAARMAETTLIQ